MMNMMSMMRGSALLIALTLLTRGSVASAQTPPETIEYYGQDAIGSIRIAYDASGNVLGRQDYAPFGNALLPASGMPKQGFGGNEKDAEIDQAYFHARMLQPRTGRFTRTDPLMSGLQVSGNLYGYALGNPLVFTDPLGLKEGGKDQKVYDFGFTMSEEVTAKAPAGPSPAERAFLDGPTSMQQMDRTGPARPDGPRGGAGARTTDPTLQKPPSLSPSKPKPPDDDLAAKMKRPLRRTPYEFSPEKQRLSPCQCFSTGRRG